MSVAFNSGLVLCHASWRVNCLIIGHVFVDAWAHWLCRELGMPLKRMYLHVPTLAFWVAAGEMCRWMHSTQPLWETRPLLVSASTKAPHNIGSDAQYMHFYLSSVNFSMYESIKKKFQCNYLNKKKCFKVFPVTYCPLPSPCIFCTMCIRLLWGRSCLMFA